jgi:hypothetical protein
LILTCTITSSPPVQQPLEQPSCEHPGGVPAVGGARAVVVDRLDVLADQPCELAEVRLGGTGRRRRELLGAPRTQDRGTDRAERHGGGPVVGPRHDPGHHRDDHGVAGADLGEGLALRHLGGQGRTDDELVRRPGVALGAGQERLPGQPPLAPLGGREDHLGVEGGEVGQGVTGRAGRPEVATDGAGAADLRRADGPRQLCERGVGARLEAAVGHAGADEPVLPVRELLDAPDRDDRLRPTVAEVHLDHHVGAAGQDGRLGMRRQCLERGIEPARSQHLHRHPHGRYVPGAQRTRCPRVSLRRR